MVKLIIIDRTTEVMTQISFQIRRRVARKWVSIKDISLLKNRSLRHLAFTDVILAL